MNDRRPGLVVSVDEFNALAHGLVWLVPLTTRPRHHSFAVEIAPPEGGLPRPSAALCHQLRTVSVERLEESGGAVSPSTLTAVLERISPVLGN